MRRIGSTPAERGSTGTNNCPDIIELDDGQYLVIGKVPADGVIKAKDFVEHGFSVGPDERTVVVPRDCLLTAARQIVAEDAGDAEARGAYRAYGVIFEAGLNRPVMTPWDELDNRIKAAWVNAAMGVRNRALMQASNKIRAAIDANTLDLEGGGGASDAADLIDPRDPRSLDSE